MTSLRLGLVLSSLALGAALLAQDDATARLVLKSGTVLTGEVLDIDNGIIEFVSEDGDELPIARIHVRAIEGGPFSDPALLWRELPSGRVAADKPEAFLRTTPNDDPDAFMGSGTLDIATAAYEHPVSKRRVYLVGVVHIGHAEYFEELQHELDAMDLVMWEGVGAKEKPTRETAERFDVLFRVQVLLKNLLNLDFQLEEIDYERPFWRNSDVSINRLQTVLEERDLELIPNEKLMKRVFGALFEVIDPEKVGRSEALGRSYRAVVAPSMVDPTAQFERAGMAAMKEVLLDLRNRHVIDDLAQVLAEPGPERIAIFYGAAHLDGMDVAVREELGFEYLGSMWHEAWRY